MYTHILWDFNGTLLDDTDIAVQSENVLLARRQMPLIENREQYQALFCYPIQSFYEKLGYDFKRDDYQALCHEWVDEYKKRIESAKLQAGALELLEKLKENGIKQVVLSASEEKMLKSQIAALKIGGYFDEILGVDTFHISDKTEIGRQWITKLRPGRAVLLGDTVHDCEVAAQMGIDCILVANGHQGFETLSKLGVPVYHNLSDLRRILLNSRQSGDV